MNRMICTCSAGVAHAEACQIGEQRYRVDTFTPSFESAREVWFFDGSWRTSSDAVGTLLEEHRDDERTAYRETVAAARAEDDGFRTGYDAAIGGAS